MQSQRVTPAPRQMAPPQQKRPPPHIHAVAGIAAGACSTTLLYPLDLVKVRFQADTRVERMPGVVAAASNAGYWAELAGGGLPRPNIFRNRVETLTSKLNSGIGFYVNLLYLNTKQWRFQFPLTLKLRREGYPVLGITIGAGTIFVLNLLTFRYLYFFPPRFHPRELISHHAVRRSRLYSFP